MSDFVRLVPGKPHSYARYKAAGRNAQHKAAGRAAAMELPVETAAEGDAADDASEAPVNGDARSLEIVQLRMCGGYTSDDAPSQNRTKSCKVGRFSISVRQGLRRRSIAKSCENPAYVLHAAVYLRGRI